MHVGSAKITSVCNYGISNYYLFDKNQQHGLTEVSLASLFVKSFSQHTTFINYHAELAGVNKVPGCSYSGARSNQAARKGPLDLTSMIAQLLLTR